MKTFKFFSKSVHTFSNSPVHMIAPWYETRLSTILSDYALADINNADEFRLFFQELPENTMHLTSKNVWIVNGCFRGFAKFVKAYLLFSSKVLSIETFNTRFL